MNSSGSIYFWTRSFARGFWRSIFRQGQLVDHQVLLEKPPCTLGPSIKLNLLLINGNRVYINLDVEKTRDFISAEEKDIQGENLY